MKALIHLDQNGKKVMERRVHEAVMKERADISTRATPRIRSYLYCDAVDACFYYAGAVPSVVVAARWTADSSDIAEGSKKLQIAAEVVRRMMTAMDKAMKAEKDRQWAAYMEEQKLK